MTLLSKNKGSPSEQPLLRERDSSEAGPSEAPPPSFEESAGHVVVAFDDAVDNFPAGGEEPPEFTPYEAEHWVSRTGDIISHDPHLNEDGEALYRFLLSQAETPPTLIIHCRGTHHETHTRLVDRTDSQGRRHTDTEHYTETVTDFDFKIECQVPPRATQWTVGDEEPAYRGRMSREVGHPGGTTKADRNTTKRFKAWQGERLKRGLPPWVGPQNDIHEGPAAFWAGVVQHPSSVDVLKSSWTLRQWSDDYCQSRKIFKEFVYEKVIYGWDLNTLEGAIRAAINSTHYRGDQVEVKFESGHRTRFHRRGGGRWAVGGGAYALKRWAFVSDGEMHDGRRVLVGEREGVWFKRWEGTIRRAVMGRKVDKRAMSEPDEEVTNWPATELDGF